MVEPETVAVVGFVAVAVVIVVAAMTSVADLVAGLYVVAVVGDYADDDDDDPVAVADVVTPAPILLDL